MVEKHNNCLTIGGSSGDPGTFKDAAFLALSLEMVILSVPSRLPSRLSLRNLSNTLTEVLRLASRITFPT